MSWTRGVLVCCLARAVPVWRQSWLVACMVRAGIGRACERALGWAMSEQSSARRGLSQLLRSSSIKTSSWLESGRAILLSVGLSWPHSHIRLLCRTRLTTRLSTVSPRVKLTHPPLRTITPTRQVLLSHTIVRTWISQTTKRLPMLFHLLLPSLRPTRTWRALKIPPAADRPCSGPNHRILFPVE